MRQDDRAADHPRHVATADDPHGKPPTGDREQFYDLGSVLRDQAERLRVIGYPPLVTIGEAVKRISTADPKDVQQIAASQIELLNAYHQVALQQSGRSFFWALIGSGAGLLLFVVAVGFSLLTGLSLASIEALRKAMIPGP